MHNGSYGTKAQMVLVHIGSISWSHITHPVVKLLACFFSAYRLLPSLLCQAKVYLLKIMIKVSLPRDASLFMILTKLYNCKQQFCYSTNFIRTFNWVLDYFHEIYSPGRLLEISKTHLFSRMCLFYDPKSLKLVAIHITNEGENSSRNWTTVRNCTWAFIP